MKTPKYFTAILFALANLVCVGTLAAQTPVATPPPAIEEDEIIKVNSRLVVVPVSVVDAQGNPVSGLGMDDFRLMEEGRRQTIESVGTAESVPLEIALLFDVSASTDRMFRLARDRAKFLREVMKSDDQHLYSRSGSSLSL